jgi:pimeloyl-ACP methyl ester carboxylesterase
MPSVPRLALSVLACAVVLPVVGCSTGTSTTPAPDDDCPDVQVVGVRGQAQSLEKNRGLGTEVDQVVTALQEDLGRDGADEVSVEALEHRSRDAADLDVYDADVTAAREELADLLRTRLRECPDAETVVVGFSQGAQIAQETLAEQPRIAARVDALGLIGNPRHNPDAGFAEVDLPGPVARLAGSLGPGPDLGDLADRTVDACLGGDVVCDADGGSDYTIHKTGYEDPAIGREIAAALAGTLEGSG